MTRDEIEAVVTAFSSLARIVQSADPQDKADIYTKLRLTLAYEPEERVVKAIMKPGLDMPRGLVSEGGLNSKTGEISLDLGLNSKTGEESPDRGDHTAETTPRGRHFI